MTGKTKLMTPSGGGVILQPSGNTASDVTVNVPSVDSTLVYQNSSGNVGIGTSSPVSKLSVLGNLELRGSNNGTATAVVGFLKGADGTQAGYWGYGTTTSPYEFVNSRNTGFAFFDGNSERMRIDSGGNLLLGASAFSTVTAKSNVYQSAINNWAHQTLGVNYGWVNSFTNTGGGYAAYFQVFNGSGYVNVGNITTSGTATAYVTSSDYRLKENIQPMQNALDVVAQLNPVTYTWKADGSDGQGFIAHELQAVVPECVTGEKDAVREVDVLDDEGKKIGTKEEPVYQGIDTSFLVATLTKAIQELKVELDEAKIRISELEAK